MGRATPASSSSGEEDGDADWKAAIDSVASIDVSNQSSNGRTKPNPDSADWGERDTDDDKKNKGSSPALKLYQIKAQKLLDDLVGKNLELVQSSIPPTDNYHKSDEGGIRLFRNAPLGILVDPIDPYSQPRKKPRIIPGEEIDEKSKKFKHRLRCVAVDGVNIMVAARDACERALTRFEAKDAAAKAKAKKEEERVAELKKVRGEKWLPSIARKMKGALEHRKNA